MATVGSVLAGKAVVYLTTDASELQKGLRLAAARLQQFGATMTAAGSGMVQAATPALLAYGNAARVYMGFDDAMRMVAATSRASGDDFQRLTNTAKELGRTTSFTAEEVANGMLSMSRMGFSPDSIINSIEPMLHLSRATGTELAEAAEIAGNNMVVFGMQATDMTSIADLLTATANGSAQTLHDLGEALKTAGPRAVTAGVGFQDLLAQLGLLANMGIRGEQAGTAISRSFQQMADPGVQKYLQDTFGIMTTDTSGNLRNMLDIFTEVGRAVEGLPTAERVQAIIKIFDIRGSLGGGALSMGAGGIDAFLSRLQQAAGDAQRNYNFMESGQGGAWRIMKSAIGGVSIALGEAISGKMTEYQIKLTDIADVVTSFVQRNQELITTIGEVALKFAALGGALIVIGKLSSALGAILKLAALLGPALTASMMSLLPIVGAVAAIAWSVQQAKQSAAQDAAAQNDADAAMVASDTAFNSVRWKTGADKKNAIIAALHTSESRRDSLREQGEVIMNRKRFNPLTAHRDRNAELEKNSAELEAEANRIRVLRKMLRETTGADNSQTVVDAQAALAARGVPDVGKAIAEAVAQVTVPEDQPPPETFDNMIDMGDSTVDNIEKMRAVGPSGAFSASAASLLGTGGNAAERTAKGVEETNRKLAQTNELLRNNLLSFG